MESCPLVAVENKETVVRCTGINSNDNVVWSRIKGSAVTGAGQCEPLPADCYSRIPNIMDLSRPSADVSTMTITSATRSLFGGATIRCDTKSGLTDTGSDSCQMDVIYPAQVTSVSVQHAHGTWKATGSCDVTKVFSSLGRYSCQWYRGTSQTSQSDLFSSTSYTTTEIPGDTDYRRGTCSFTADIPPTSGTYYYRVVVHPGGTENVSGPVTVDEPSTPTITGCSPDVWAPIGSQLMCTCNTNDIGQPAGRLQWVRDGSVVKSGNYGDNSLSTTPVTLTQGDDGSQFTCRVEWIQDKQSATHTVRMAWGPNSVSIPQSGTFDTDSSGSRDLSLSCNATDVNPSTNLTYSWTGRCQGNTGSTCRFQPKPSGDDGMVVGCTVTNPYNNNQQRQGSYTLDLNSPVIMGYTTGQAVYADDSLSLTCQVSGGKPLVTSVTFTCQSRHPDNPNDVTVSGSVSSSLDVSVTQYDDGITCSCTARWKVASYYRDSADTTLTVYYSLPFPYLEGDTVLSLYVTDSLPFPYVEGDTVLSLYDSLPFPYLEGDTVLSLYVTDSLPFPYLEGDISVTDPPSTPAISRTDNLPFPFLEGDTVRLSCDLQSRGKPTASLTWSGHGNGQITNPDGAPATLVMTSVGKEDNNRNITCRTSNAWTQYKGQDISYVFPLQVYYSPQIRMTSQAGSNRCQLIQNTTQCVVIQGQRVHFTCSADSNPPPATIVWRKNNSQDGDLDIGAGPDLDIQSANHTKHNGNFSCHVTTGNLQGTGRTRNPLTSSDQLTVLSRSNKWDELLSFLKAPFDRQIDSDIPERSSLFLSHVTGNLTVSEGDDAVLACLADGRPTPDMTLVKKETGSRVHYVKGGVLVVEDRDSWLNYTITSAQCSDTGTYTCTTRNDVGTGPETSGAIFVSCKPRSATPPAVDVPSVNYVNQSVHLTFNLWALPVPDRYEILYLGQFRNQTAARVSGIAFDVQFIVTGELYNISCDVTVVNVTDDTAAGFYQLNVTNTHGHEQLVFQVKYNEERRHVAPRQNGVAYGAIGGGIAAAIVVAVIIGAVIFIRKRRLRTPALQTTRGSARQSTSLHDTGNESTGQPSVFDGLRPEAVGQRSAYATWQLSGASVQTSDYEHLRMGD
ncbi:hypothetical protein BaRGS_00023235, partial [Batillaria attramentaria]